MVDPISIIVGALVAGATAAVKDTSSAAVKDTYAGLKTLIVNHWKMSGKAEEQEQNQARAEDLLQDLEADPETYQKPALVKLQKIMPQPPADIVDQAKALETALKAAGIEVKQYSVTMQHVNNAIVGDGNTMTINK